MRRVRGWLAALTLLRACGQPDRAAEPSAQQHAEPLTIQRALRRAVGIDVPHITLTWGFVAMAHLVTSGTSVKRRLRPKVLGSNVATGNLFAE
jgi:hypothetical protein